MACKSSELSGKGTFPASNNTSPNSTATIFVAFLSELYVAFTTSLCPKCQELSSSGSCQKLTPARVRFINSEMEMRFVHSSSPSCFH